MTQSSLIRSRALGAALAGILAVAGVLSGCSGGDSSTNAAPAATTTAGGTPPAATPTAGNTPASPDTKPAAGGAADGASLFAANCAGCHGDKGVGKRAPVLAGKHLKEDDVNKIVTDGKKPMPPFKGRLKDDEIKAVAAYVASL